MKKLKYLCSAFLFASLLAIPGAAQKGGMGHHSSGFGQPLGQMRADKDAGKHNPDKDKPKKKKKKKRDKDQDPAASMNKNGNGNHNAEGHIH